MLYLYNCRIPYQTKSKILEDKKIKIEDIELFNEKNILYLNSPNILIKCLRS
jgi:hypothetical protein